MYIFETETNSKGFVVKQQHEGAGAEIQHDTIRTKNRVVDLNTKRQ